MMRVPVKSRGCQALLALATPPPLQALSQGWATAGSRATVGLPPMADCDTHPALQALPLRLPPLQAPGVLPGRVGGSPEARALCHTDPAATPALPGRQGQPGETQHTAPALLGGRVPSARHLEWVVPCSIRQRRLAAHLLAPRVLVPTSTAPCARAGHWLPGDGSSGVSPCTPSTHQWPLRPCQPGATSAAQRQVQLPSPARLSL